MTEQRHKILRNIFILIGIVGGFVIWHFIPTVIKNDSLVHVGNDPYGLKWGLLVLLPIPLFSLIRDNEELTFHSDDEELKNTVHKNAAQKQMLIAICTSGTVLISMAVALLFH